MRPRASPDMTRSRKAPRAIPALRCRPVKRLRSKSIRVGHRATPVHRWTWCRGVADVRLDLHVVNEILVKMLHHGVGAGSVQGLLERLAPNAPFSWRLLFASRTSRLCPGERHCRSSSRTLRSSKSGAKGGVRETRPATIRQGSFAGAAQA